jgi:tRNA U34 5-carboxymethylaminomethyl modifying GTPase MnmE/TrmE
MASNPLTREHVLEVVESFTRLASSLNDERAIQRLQAPLRQYQFGSFQLVVVGEIKKGKSSFINALLGQRELLPSLSDVATSTVFKVMYGPSLRYRVFFMPRDPDHPKESTPDPIDLSREQVAEYGTEDGNPKNGKGVDFIGVQLPSPLLKSGLTIIDTPGLGGLFREHSEITWRYVPGADALFFVLDSVEAVVSKNEATYLQRLRKMTPLLFFVQTKIDLVGTEQAQAWRERNLAIIGNTLDVPPQKLIYFPISSELKHIADDEKSPRDLDQSGFSPLLIFFNSRLLKAKEEKQARALLSRIAIEVTDLKRQLADQLRVLGAETKEALDALEQEFKQAQAEFDTWRRNDYPQRLKRYQDESADLKRESMEKLQNFLDPSPNGQLITAILDGVKQGQMGPTEMAERAGEIQSGCIELCTRHVFDVQTHYNTQMGELIASALGERGKASEVAEHARNLTVTGASVPIQARLDVHFSGFERASSTFLGGSAGVSMACLVAGVFFPPAGVTIAAMIGGVAGLLSRHREVEKRREEQVINKLQGMLSDTVRTVQRQALQQFSATATALERSARDGFESAAAEAQKELQEKLDAISRARQGARGDAEAKAAKTREQIRQVEKLLADIAGSPAQPRQKLTA